MRAAACVALCAIALACAGSKNGKDTFVAGGSDIAAWAVTPDGRVKVPLATGVSWGQPTPAKEPKDSTLLKVRGEAGPTFVIIARVDDAPKPIALGTCAKAHAERIAQAVAAAGVYTSPPTISDELRRGERVPRLHYVVPLAAAPGVRGAATISWWTYFVDRERCIAVGVTAVVHEKADDPKSPDPDDLHRLERVFAMVSDGTVIAQ